MPFLTDGFSTIITFSLAPVARFKEKTTQPPGFDGGGPNDTTTMRNSAFRTMQPKKLITLTEVKVSAAYDPAVITAEVLNDLLNINQLITVTFSDGSSIQFFGWLDKFIPNPCKEGEQPTAELTIHPSNQDDNNNEVAPVFTPAA